MSLKPVQYLQIPADLEKPMKLITCSSLDDLQAGIGGGYIEAVNLRQTVNCPGARMYVDEEFVYKPELQVNFRASVLAQVAGVFQYPDQVIGGDVLLFGPVDGPDDNPPSPTVQKWAADLEALLKQKGVI